MRIVSRSAAVGDVQEYFSVGVSLDTLQHWQQTAADLGEKGKAILLVVVRENLIEIHDHKHFVQFDQS